MQCPIDGNELAPGETCKAHGITFNLGEKAEQVAAKARESRERAASLRADKAEARAAKRKVTSRR